ncbi:hypothetical protein PP182_00935 [Maribacter sp. PR1]|uniref:Uncharacterized protein n=1 Tax=Maribacter cobaltidurans TaxID=1178778 RepID=A0ABU7INT2_9FLAO|nr:MULTISPECIES: hypothetical protein [Maribacter]MDC6387229.1 hypothetical protein [Maribacter sp. PR1]MEE1974614.1 hypothetical protein [Maribacter cobaltidurans]
MLRSLLLVLTMLLSNLISAQINLNDYKYIVVPKRFEAFKEVNQYQTSTLVKFLFSERGFNVVYDDALPQDLNINRCLGLLVGLKDDSTMFTTKTSLSLKDCNGVEIFLTMEGKSKIKEYRGAYNEAIKEAMISFNGLNYVYSGKQEKEKKPLVVSFKNDVKSLKNKKIAEKLEPKGTNTDKVQYKEPKNKKPMVVQEATTENQSYKSMEPVSSNIGASRVNNDTAVEEIWYAQVIPNGYQLVDSSPKVRMKLFKSSNENMFMAQSEGKSGMVYQKDGQWIFEYYEGDKLVQEQLNLKF